MARTDTQRKRICGIDVELTRKPIKHFYIRVLPPDGNVRMSVPLRARNADIHSMVDERLEWISARRTEILKSPPASPVEVLWGEAIALWGTERRLEVYATHGQPSVSVLGSGNVLVNTGVGAGREQRVRQLREFYRAELKSAAEPLFVRWSAIMDVGQYEWRTKKMGTRWGTCNVNAKRIWLSLDLARRGPCCLESVIVHELNHLLERNHTQRFWSLMDHFHPSWRLAEGELRHNPSPRIE
ncbi:MAG: M48 family metallopeptidase [Acidimicrobiales bacterium]